MAFNIKYVYDLVDNISPQLKKIKQSVKHAEMAVKQSAAKMTTGFDKMKRKLEDVGRRARDVGKSLFLKLTVPIGLMGGVAIKAASDFEESMNKVDVAFGDAAQSVKDFAQTAGTNFGIDRGAALDMAAMFGDMSTSMGLSRDMASTLSQQLVGLAGDLASFKNINVEQATTALAGVFTGETESLKRLGVVMTETNLKQFALEQGITKNIKRFTQAEKVLLRYKFIMQKTKNAQGDFLRTGEGFANQMRKLNSNLNDLKISFGLILLPIATKLVNMLAKLVIKFNALSPTAKKIILVVAGIAAVASPLLIAFGLMIPALAALAGGFKILTAAMLANPIGLIVTGIGLATLGIIKLKNKLNEMGFTLSDIPSLALDSFKRNFPMITKIISAALTPIFALKDAIDGLFDAATRSLDFISNKVNAVKDFMGIGGGDSTTDINQNQSLTVGGQLGIDIKGLPKGSSANFTPAPGNKLPVGMNTVYAGG